MTRFPRRIAGLLAFAALAMTAAGCGGKDTSASDAYVGQVNNIQAQLVSSYQRLASEITSTSRPGNDAEIFAKLDNTLGVSVARLRAVEVPQEVRRQHAELASALEAYRADLTTAAGALTSGGGAPAAQARSDLEKQTATLSDTFSRKIREINAKLGG